MIDDWGLKNSERKEMSDASFFFKRAVYMKICVGLVAFLFAALARGGRVGSCRECA
jgi:hypothetical protein